MASSASTADLYAALRLRLLTFAPTDGAASLAARLSGGLSIVAVPDDAPYPYGAIRLLNAGAWQSHGERVQAELELLLFGRPRVTAPELEDAADVAQQALLRHTITTDGGVLRVLGLRNRTTLPPFKDPADAEVVQIRLTWDVTYWPRFLTQYAST